ncbi:histidine phosphatase family protein [Sulfurimonas sp. CS5]|jgi:broad specificity phosphatase PhoE|uniref:histidine phosphatase family protein n=1 Tax=Sulfurimonas sp. CS5 TaxID=3391145 RepID=UPI0039EB205B
MKITLVRHAEVEEKYIGCYNGQIDIGLSPKGYVDAKELKKHFKASDFDAIFCSDLIRTKETLKQFIKSDKVIYTKELREKSWGDYEGMSFEEITSTTNLTYVNFKQWTDALGGEEIEKFISRVEKFFFEYLPTLKKKNILVVTHSGVIKTYLHLLKGISLEEAFSISVPYSSFVSYDNENEKHAIITV